MGVIPMVQLDANEHDNPESFCPDRFNTHAAEQALIWPHGVFSDDVKTKGHICPGKDVAMLYGKRLCYELVRGFSWQFEEKVEWDDRKFSLNVASPKGTLTTKSFVRRNWG